MSTYRLEKLFAPQSVAVVGASPREGSVGLAVLRNLREGGFKGRIEIVNPDFESVDGIPCVDKVENLAETPDLIIVMTPPAIVPEIIASAGRKGVAGAVIIATGLGHGPGSFAARTEAIAREHGIRIVGPNCIGVLSTPSKLNASFASRSATPGDMAFISQSGTVAASLVEWAAMRKVGFSTVVSLGDQMDVDFADCMDYFANDRYTRAILLYVEEITDTKKFMSAARAAARAKPVVVIKSGRHEQAARAAATHTGALVGRDEVYDAAFRRAGLLRVYDLEELFAAAEALGRQKPFPGKRLAIVSNGGGLGVLSVDSLIDLDGELAELSPTTMKALDDILPKNWSRANPIDLVGDAKADRYAATLSTLLADENVDAILVLHVPTALTSPAETAQAVAEVVKTDRAKTYRKKPVFAVWFGEDSAAEQCFTEAGIPYFSTESDAVRGFMHLVRYREAQDALMETPDSLPQDFHPNTIKARKLIEKVLAEGRQWLDPIEVGEVMNAYTIPINPLTLARTPDEAVEAAKPVLDRGGAVAVKILSPQIVHKSDIGGVVLDLATEQTVREAAEEILARARKHRPDATIVGVTVQEMIRRPKARELIAGIADDPAFGPVITFGRGGTAVEIINDKALALPPLDLKLAHEQIARTRVSRILKEYRDVPAADVKAVATVLVKLAQLSADLPEIREVDINPFLADKDGVIGVDARVMVATVPPEQRRRIGNARFAIRPYPKEWERTIMVRDGRRVFIRPVRPEDEGLFLAFFKQISEEDLRLRFFAPIRDFNHSFLVKLVQIDYARAIAFVAIDNDSGEMMGAVRLHSDANNETGEYGILLRSDLKGLGLGRELMRLIIAWAHVEGLKFIEGQVLRENTPMLDMCRKLGFSIHADPNDHDVRICKLPVGGPGGGLTQ